MYVCVHVCVCVCVVLCVCHTFFMELFPTPGSPDTFFNTSGSLVTL